MRKHRANKAGKEAYSASKMVLGASLTALFLTMLVVTVLFYRTKKTMEDKYMETIQYASERISSDLDEMTSNIYAVSDVFARDSEIQEYYEKDYTDYKSDARKMKLYDMGKMRKQIFPSYDFLRTSEQISAIYNRNGVLYNFLDANNDGADVIEKIEALGANDTENLAKLKWYPLMQDFLSKNAKENVRENHIILGTRRVYSWKRRDFVGLHLFAVREQDLYDMYRDELSVDGIEIYITDAQGHLLSSSREDLVAKGAMDEALQTALARIPEKTGRTTLQENGKIWLIQQRISAENGWKTVVLVPLQGVVGPVNHLYGRIFAVLFACVVLLAGMFVYIFRTRLQMLKERQSLEMSVLMAQINPHFLYNTLENIVWKANEAKRPDIGKLAASLGRLYRLSISGGNIIRMQQEVEHLMAYINIQKNRYGEKLDFELLTDYEVTQWLYVPKLILQPVVENAIHYGMNGIAHPLRITLEIQIEENEVRLIVTDNGSGIDEARLSEVRRQIRYGRKAVQDELSEQDQYQRSKGTGIGLYSVSERIRIYLHKENAVLVESSLGEGTRVTIILPLLTKEDAEKLMSEEARG